MPELHTLPYNSYVHRGTLVTGGWDNALLRLFIPYYASAQDRKVSAYFTKYFKQFLQQDLSTSSDCDVQKMLTLAEQHIARGKGWFGVQTQDTCRLEHYTLVVRKRLGNFTAQSPQSAQVETCRLHNKTMLDKWIKLGFPEQAFFDYPDLVDFIFKPYLHRHIRHPFYNHTIEMRTAIVRQDGRLICQLQPHLLMDGRWTPWTEIRTKLKIDRNLKLYSLESGFKQHWKYLENGFTRCDTNDLDNMRPLCRPNSPTAGLRVEVITTHAHKNDWNPFDKYLQGTRHAFLRVVPNQNFCTRYAHLNMEGGALYSLGWAMRWREFSILKPLATQIGKWFCPDNFEYVKEDLCVTPLSVTDEQLSKLIEIIKQRSKEDYPFHYITGNCSGATGNVLREAGIVDIHTKDHIASVLYKLALPKPLREPLEKIAQLLRGIIPEWLATGIKNIRAFVYSVVFAPLLSVLGAWRTTLSYEQTQGAGNPGIAPTTSNKVKALFSNVYDVFNQSNMEIDLTKKIYKWQKRQSQSYFERRE